MRILVWFSLFLLVLGILISWISTITQEFSVMDYGYGRIAFPPKYSQYYWSVLVAGPPRGEVIVNGTVIYKGIIEEVQFQKNQFYVYAVNGKIQPYADLSPLGLLLILLGTGLGLRSTALALQEKYVKESFEIEGKGLTTYLAKRSGNLISSLIVILIITILIEIKSGFTVIKAVQHLLTFNLGNGIYGVSVDSLLLTSLSFTDLLTGVSFILTVYLSTFLTLRAYSSKGYIYFIISRWKYIGNALSSWVIGIGLLYLGNFLSYHHPNFIFPVISLFFPYIGIFANKMLFSIQTIPREVIAKGLTREILMYKHVMGNLMLVTLSTISAAFVEMLIAEFLVESIFGWPGLGTLARISVDSGNMRTIEGILLFYSTLVLMSNAISDMVYGFLDPRVRK
ncbi:ABC transporter permease [Acidianus sp. RZ1]|uniref:ABC transporter permease subunit n=1 Tax=Acidianus sp. RZ1 TaxID=1540082 RepID=UPI00149142C7|nr:ABC transporter permease [Acidianus sp. RZ1]NON62752.1 ABC transporter permease [Acidianus sp. RZ1]